MQENKTPQKENIMGTAPINPLLIKLAVPMIISMLVQALYNVVDSIFVSRVSETALSAVSLAFPVQNLMIAFAVGTGVGVNALVSRLLGERHFADASKAAENGLFLSLCSYLPFGLFGLFLVRPFFAAQTGDAVLLEYAVQYTSIVAGASVFCFVQCMGEKLLSSTGKTSLAMTTQLLGALTNIVLDPIFIFGLFGAPRMEAAGAAVATVLGQAVGCAASLLLNLRRNRELSISFKGFRPSARIIGRIYSVGFPSIAMQAVGSVMTFSLNQILISFSSTAVAVFGVYFKLQSFVFMPVFGLNNGMVPIVSYNFGARRPHRMVQTIKLSMIYATGIMVLGFLAAQLFPTGLLSAFNASADMMSIGTVCLRVLSIAFLLAGFNIVSSSVFQALGHGMLALWVSVGRQLVVLLPAAWLLSLSGRLELVWWAFPIAELASLILCLVFLARVNRETLRPLFEAEKNSQPS